MACLEWPSQAQPPRLATTLTTDRITTGDAGCLWQVSLLGGLQLRHCQSGVEFNRLPSRAVTTLLARVALQPQRAHAREELIELLWPGVALDVGRNRLRQALSTLKSLLEPAGAPPGHEVLTADRQHVRVVAGALGCDAVQFEVDVRAGRGVEARALYRGELLPGFYDDWVQEERLRLAALHDRIATADPVGFKPPGDGPRGAQMPRLADGKPQARVQLPNYLTRMFGAEAPAARLRAAILEHRLVTLLGPGGAGETRLAVEVAHSLRSHAQWPLAVADPRDPFDLIAFVPLVSCTTRAQALDALLGHLQIAPADADPIDTLADALDGRRALLVLDNFEQLLDEASDVVAALVSRLPWLHLVVTSRRGLGVDGERQFPLEPLALPDAECALAQAAANPAIRLFVERAQAVRADFHLADRNAGTLVALVRELEGMPLAIELAASRVRSITPHQMLERLRGAGTPRLDLLSRSGARTAHDTRHASMQRVIAWSWEQLSPAQARFLSALTVFPGGFDTAAAARLIQGEAIDPELTLDDLVAHSLIFTRGADDNQRFGIYEPIREFAQAALDEPARRHWRSRLCEWALEWTRALPATPPLPRLRVEMPNLVAALGAAVHDGVPERAVETLLALRRSLEDVELSAEGLVHARAAAVACRDDVMRARAHALVAAPLYTAGQRDVALAHAREGVDRHVLPAPQLSRALHALARVLWRGWRRAAEVEPLIDEAQQLIEGLDEPEILASLFALRAFVTNAHHRDHVEGERLHAQALALWRQLGNRARDP